MNPGQLQNEGKAPEWTIVYDRAVPPAHSVTFAAQEHKPQPECGTRRGVHRTLTPPACRWVDRPSSSTENATEPSPPVSPDHPTVKTDDIPSDPAPIHQGGIANTITLERTNDAGPRLPQRLPAGSILSPTKKSTQPSDFETHCE